MKRAVQIEDLFHPTAVGILFLVYPVRVQPSREVPCRAMPYRRNAQS